VLEKPFIAVIKCAPSVDEQAVYEFVTKVIDESSNPIDSISSQGTGLWHVEFTDRVFLEKCLKLDGSSGDFFGVSALRHDKPRGGPRDGGPRGGFRDGPRDFNRRGGARDDRDANATPREPPAPSVRKPLALVKPTAKATETANPTEISTAAVPAKRSDDPFAGARSREEILRDREAAKKKEDEARKAAEVEAEAAAKAAKAALPPAASPTAEPPAAQVASPQSPGRGRGNGNNRRENNGDGNGRGRGKDGGRGVQSGMRGRGYHPRAETNSQAPGTDSEQGQSKDAPADAGNTANNLAPPEPLVSTCADI